MRFLWISLIIQEITLRLSGSFYEFAQSLDNRFPVFDDEGICGRIGHYDTLL